MRWFLLIAWSVIASAVVGCAPDRVINCHCVSPGVPRDALEGTFVYSVESVEVLAGDYVPPALPAPTPALALMSEDFLVWQLPDGGAQLALRVMWQDVRPDPASTGGCCSALGGEGLAFTFPQPRWNERNRALIDVTAEFGQVVSRLDPTLERVEPMWFDWLDEDEITLPFEVDDLGLLLRADYFIMPSGCADPSCAATIRVTHRLRRPD